MKLPENIKKLRKHKGWSQTELGEKIGSHLSHINRLETGKYKPSLEVLLKLAETLGVSLDDLVQGNGDDAREVTIADKNLSDRIKLIDNLDREDRQALIRVIDSMLTKKKILQLVTGGHETMPASPN